MKSSVIISVFLISISLGGPIEDLAPGHWYEVPGSRLDAIDPEDNPVYNPDYPANAPWHGVQGLKAIINSWSGGAMDSKRSKLLVWGGGHADYGGNEIYGFDMNTLKWEMLSAPSKDMGGDPASCLYPDGKPRSFHTHNYIEYVPDLDKFVSFGGVGPYPISATTSKVFSFSFSSSSWEAGAIPNVPYGSARAANAVYDPVLKAVWFHGGASSKLCLYNPALNSWITYNPTKYVSLYGTAALDPDRRLLVLCGGYGGTPQFLVWDLNKPNEPCFSPQTSGDTRLERENAPGFEFDPVSKKFVGWDGGDDVYILDPDTWHWEKTGPASSNTVVPTTTSYGQYGRFRYVPKMNVFAAVNDVSENVFIYRLTEGPGTTSKDRPIQANRASAMFQPCKVKIFSITGKLVETFKLDSNADRFRWNKAGRPAGVYICRFQAGTRIWSKKLLIHR